MKHFHCLIFLRKGGGEGGETWKRGRDGNGGGVCEDKLSRL